jgi:hypothetical protein
VGLEAAIPGRTGGRGPLRNPGSLRPAVSVGRCDGSAPADDDLGGRIPDSPAGVIHVQQALAGRELYGGRFLDDRFALA